MVVLQSIKPSRIGCTPTSSARLNLSLKRGRARRALASLGNNNTQQNLQLAESLLTISAEEFTHKWNFDPIQGIPLPSGRFQWTPLNPVTSSPLASDLSKAVTSSSDVPKAVTTTSPDLHTSAGDDGANPMQVKGQEEKSQSQPELDLNQKSTSEKEECQEKNATDSHNCCPRTCLACSTDNNTASENNSKEKKMSVQQTANSSSTPRVPSNSICSEKAAVAADSGVDSNETVIEGTEMSVFGQSQKIKLRQTCITDFVKPKKLSTFKIPETLQQSSSSSTSSSSSSSSTSSSSSSSSTNTTSSNSSSFSKKRSASSLQDHPLGQPPHKKVLLHLRA